MPPKGKIPVGEAHLSVPNAIDSGNSLSRRSSTTSTPGDRATGSAKPKITKSRNGCITCKAKRLKCDEAKPTCLVCTKRNVACGGYKKNFKWKSFDESSFVEGSSSKARDMLPASECGTWPTSPALSSGSESSGQNRDSQAVSATEVPLSNPSLCLPSDRRSRQGSRSSQQSFWDQTTDVDNLQTSRFVSDTAGFVPPTVSGDSDFFTECAQSTSPLLDPAFLDARMIQSPSSPYSSSAWQLGALAPGYVPMETQVTPNMLAMFDRAQPPGIPMNMAHQTLLQTDQHVEFATTSYDWQNESGRWQLNVLEQNASLEEAALQQLMADVFETHQQLDVEMEEQLRPRTRRFDRRS